MKAPAIILLAALITSGCASVPFERIELVTLADVTAEDVIKKAESSTARDFTVLNSIVFKLRWHSMSALGYTSLNMDENNFTVQALNPMGIKLFEFADKSGDIETIYCMEQIAKRGDVTSTVAKDIRRIYFNRVPSENAQVKKDEKTFTFTEKAANATVRYVFGGKDTVLIKKQYYVGRRKVWTASYYDYQTKENELYPGGIVLMNHKYNYRLTVSLKEICSEQTK